MLAILGGLGAAFAWAGTTFTAARATRLIDPWSLLATVMAVGFLVTVPAAAISGIPDALDAKSAVWLAVSGAGNVVGLLFTYSALRVGKVGLVAPVTSTEGGVAALLAVAAGEPLGAGVGATLGVIACGVALTSLVPAAEDPGEGNDLRAIVLAGCGAVAFGSSLYATGRVGQDLGIAWAVLPPRVVGVAAIALPLALRRRWHMKRGALPYAVAGGLLEVLGFVSYAFGARHNLAVSAVLASQFAAVAVVLAYVVLHERPARHQVVGVVTILCGVTVLGVLRS
jgi:drug/metabolite transporter (DMT)-like permease